MIEYLYLGLILLFFILAFAVRNIKTYMATKQSIRGRSIKLTLSILLSTAIYLLLILRILIPNRIQLFELNFIENEIFRIAGFIFVTIGFFLGIIALITMKNSWRVGIKYDQKTSLVTNGVFRISRNPYFLSYDILIFGYLLIFPSVILCVLYLILVYVFHRMIIEEEIYLESVHGNIYIRYKNKVCRYMTFKIKSQNI